MGLFDKVFCSECGKEAKLLTRTKLQDGCCLCGEHMKKVPSCMKSSVREHYTLKDYHALMDYLEYANTYLRPKYHETHYYSGISLDAIHGIFHFGYGIKDNTVFYETKNVTYFDLAFTANEVKEGIIGTKVTGDVTMLLEMDQPPFAHSEKVAYSQKAKAKTSLFGNKVTYESPKDMSEFLDAFLSSCISRIEAQYYEDDPADDYDNHQNYESHSPSELQSAMVLFMFDDLENITLDKVKMQRNRLIKTFHPDKGSADDTNYAQKINNAYDILKNYIEQANG